MPETEENADDAIDQQNKPTYSAKDEKKQRSDPDVNVNVRIHRPRSAPLRNESKIQHHEDRRSTTHSNQEQLLAIFTIKNYGDNEMHWFWMVLVCILLLFAWFPGPSREEKKNKRQARWNRKQLEEIEEKISRYKRTADPTCDDWRSSWPVSVFLSRGAATWWQSPTREPPLRFDAQDRPESSTLVTEDAMERGGHTDLDTSSLADTYGSKLQDRGHNRSVRRRGADHEEHPFTSPSHRPMTERSRGVDREAGDGARNNQDPRAHNRR